MKIRIIALASLLFSTAVAAQQAPPPAPPKPGVAQPRTSLVSRPSLEPVQQVFLASRIRSVQAVLVIEYDAKGVPTKLELDPPSGSAELDAAIIEWGRQVRLSPGKAGKGRLPFDLVNDELDAQSSIDVEIKDIPNDRIAMRPPLQPVMRALAEAGAPATRFEFILFFDAQGKVIDATIARGARGDGADRAALLWAREVRLKPGQAGAGRIAIDVRPEAASRTP